MDTGDVTAVAGAIVLLLGALGGGVKFLFLRVDKREAAFEARQQAFIEKMEARQASLEQRYSRLHLAFQIVAAELQRLDPRSTALIRAQELLTMSYPVSGELPGDIDALMRKLDGMQ